jgi:hypothetical protein
MKFLNPNEYQKQANEILQSLKMKIHYLLPTGALPLEMLNGEFHLQDFKVKVYNKSVELIQKRSLDYRKCR